MPQTAMQGLIVHLEMLKSRVDMVDVNSLIEYAATSLEKEKEQIIEAHNNAVISPYTELYVHKIQGKSPITKGEEYYNQKYIQ